MSVTWVTVEKVLKLYFWTSKKKMFGEIPANNSRFLYGIL